MKIMQKKRNSHVVNSKAAVKGSISNKFKLAANTFLTFKKLGLDENAIFNARNQKQADQDNIDGIIDGGGSQFTAGSKSINNSFGDATISSQLNNSLILHT